MTQRSGLRGDRLRAARERLGMTQQDIEREAGINQQHYSRYETGRVDPNTEQLVRLATVLRVSTDYLVGLSDDTGDDDEERGLSPMERRLLWLVDKGYTLDAIAMLAGLPRDQQQGVERGNVET